MDKEEVSWIPSILLVYSLSIGTSMYVYTCVYYRHMELTDSNSRLSRHHPDLFPWVTDCMNNEVAVFGSLVDSYLFPGQGVVSWHMVPYVSLSVPGPSLFPSASSQLQKLLLATSSPTASSDALKDGATWSQTSLSSRSQRPCVKVFPHMPRSNLGP